ncbi:hypothetical protein CLU79DRAFT_726481 [Phycomyces nitens]|nr:hypothetical protein CLU79DRAFT_726481 [Phycomyces nitens]
MDHHLETLEHQTAPESTRGLFDPPEQKPIMRNSSADNRRSFHVFGPGLESTRLRQSQPPATGNNGQAHRGHQRSRSAITSDMLSNHGGRRNIGLQTLTEENPEKQQQREEAGRSVTIDKLQSMINVMRTIPPTKDEPVRQGGHRKQQSMSALSFGPVPPKRMSYGGDAQSMLQSSVQDLRSIDKNDRRRSVRNSSISEHNDDDAFMSREAALAEAEAKLTGTFKREPDMRRNSGMRYGLDEQSSSSSRNSFNGNSFNGNNRRFSESGPLDTPPITTNKRMSLQLPTLTENSEEGARTGRRIQFNKPLNLVPEDKKTHSRRSSRNFDYDWRSSSSINNPVPCSPRSSRASFNLLVPFTPTKVNFARDDANPHQRRPLFIAHLPFSALTPLFRSRNLVRGLLRVNKRNRSDAYVACEDLDADIYVCGSRDRNRALEGDVVAIRLVDVEKILREKREKEEAKLTRNGGHVRVRQPDEEDENEIIFGGDEDVDTVKPKYCGVVVAILERAQNQVFSGTLTLMRPNNKRAQEEKAAEEAGQDTGRRETPRIVWFKATDKRVPLIAIPIEQAPTNFVENNEAYADRLFVGSIKRWPITSLHPFGTLERELGHITDLPVQTMAILADNNVTDMPFAEQVMLCLPPMPYSLPTDTSDNQRRDLRSTRIFTLDPENSRVLDDAFSIEKLGDGLYEIGVHVSDVAYFIKPHSPLDKEARARAVRVELMHKNVPMLPTELTEQVTNLVPNESRYAFSVIWKISSRGVVCDTWFGKTIIRSCAQLSYQQGQEAIEGRSIPGLEDVAVEQDIRTLYDIATNLRETRFADGALSQKIDELEFESGPDSVPTSISTKSELPVSKIIKELHLLANYYVAQRITSCMPEQALLRRHAPPLDRKIRELQVYADRFLGVSLDITDAHTIESSIESIQDPTLRKLVSVLVLKTLSPPKYFCTGTLDITKFSHYASNVPLFSHFTAPSSRFVDIIVHRQLEAALSDTRFYLDRDNVQKLAQHSNVKREASLYARAQSNLLFLALHLNSLAQQNADRVVYRQGIVVAVFENSFDVMVPELNMEKRIHIVSLPMRQRPMYDPVNQSLTMYWKKGVDTFTGEQHQWAAGGSDEEYDDLDDEALLAEMAEEEEAELVGMRSERSFKALSIHDNNSFQYRGSINNMASTNHNTTNNSANGSVNKRMSISRARLSDGSSYGPDQGVQTIKALDKIHVMLTIEMVRTPPLIRILAANPTLHKTTFR